MIPPRSAFGLLLAYREAVVASLIVSWSTPSAAFPAEVAAQHVANAAHVVAACWRAGYPPAKCVRALHRCLCLLHREGFGADAGSWLHLSDDLPSPRLRPFPVSLSGTPPGVTLH